MKVYLFPGQGSQKVGMGEGLFERYAEMTAQADAILGYSIKELCLSDPQGQLGQTQFTQPALYVVNALTYQQKLEEGGGQKPAFAAGHSLGEYCALYAAGSFDFETGLKLVQKRGALMGEISGGGMAAVIGKGGEELRKILDDAGLGSVDLANFNSTTQIVISGMKADVDQAQGPVLDSGAMFFPLNVSGAFHSRYMKPVRDEFEAFMGQYEIATPSFPVIANYSAKPYTADTAKSNLIEQLDHSVKWCDSIQYILDQGGSEFVEVGPGMVLSGLVAKIKQGK